MTGTPLLYDSGFYQRQSGSSLHAALEMLPVVFECLSPAAVVDVGCGVGTWLAAAHKCGAKRVVGLEGDWVSRQDLKDTAIELINCNLEHRVPLDEQFDLALSLEVAEHLSPPRGESFIEDLCRLSRSVLFSAAIPGQGGVNHLNERWQSYWVELFEARGYRPLDILRPRFWHDSSIPIHYRQNALLYVHSSIYTRVADAAGSLAHPQPWAKDIVHPGVHLNNLAEMTRPRTLKETLRIAASLPLAVGRSIQSRLPNAAMRTGGGPADA